MVNFVLVESDYDHVPEKLLRAVPGFAESAEFLLVRDNTDLTGVVAAAFARYIVRLTEEAGSSLDDSEITVAYEFLEQLVNSDDTAIVNMISTEMLPLFLDFGAFSAILNRCTPRARRRLEGLERQLLT